MGPIDEKISLIKVNLLNGQRQIVTKDIAFINNVKWNRSGSCAAFGGGGKLTLYDLNKDRLLFEKELENDPAAYFGWSPDGKVLYTEHPNLPNGSKIYIDEEKIQRASASIYINGDNSSGGGFGSCYSMELIKIDEKWYITGFSTYPGSKQAEELKKKVQQWVKDTKSGKLFDGVLKGKEVKIGQIQFWQMSSPHLADNIDYANYCKVYLRVMENGQENIYKMVLSKNSNKEWKPESISKDRLHSLF